MGGRPSLAVLKPVMTITSQEWEAKRRRGMAATIDGQPYIVALRAPSNEPVYQAVQINSVPQMARSVVSPAWLGLR